MPSGTMQSNIVHATVRLFQPYILRLSLKISDDLIPISENVHQG